MTAVNTLGFKAIRYYDFIPVLDDGTNEIYYAQLVEEESTAACMAAVCVIEQKGCLTQFRRASNIGSLLKLTSMALLSRARFASNKILAVE